MSLKIGIIGLPNVGKSTLFKAITNLQVKISNYPFTTINPNIGIVEIPDKRINTLNFIFKRNKLIYSIFEFHDIAGLIYGASKGKGLGNIFLKNIENIDLICMVIRCFDNKDVIHVEKTINPIRDIEIINLELIIYDQEQIKKRINNINKKLQILEKKELFFEYELLLKIENILKKNKFIKELKLSKNELKIIKKFNLLTVKPIIYIANISENNLNKNNNFYIKKIKEYSNEKKIEVIIICAKIEEEFLSLNKIEKKILMNDYNIKELALIKLIKKSYSILELQTFFTIGKKEIRSWIIKKGTTAIVCAGMIHSDFKLGFICLEVYSCFDLFKYMNEKLIKSNGLLRNEGKNYIIKDGDICFFKFNI